MQSVQDHSDSVYAVLQRAKPRWNEDELGIVHSKLQKVNIGDVQTLGDAVSRGNVNTLLAAAGERRFKGSTLQQLSYILRPIMKQQVAAAALAAMGSLEEIVASPLSSALRPGLARKERFDGLQRSCSEPGGLGCKDSKRRGASRQVASVSGGSGNLLPEGGALQYRFGEAGRSEGRLPGLGRQVSATVSTSTRSSPLLGQAGGRIVNSSAPPKSVHASVACAVTNYAGSDASSHGYNAKAVSICVPTAKGGMRRDDDALEDLLRRAGGIVRRGEAVASSSARLIPAAHDQHKEDKLQETADKCFRARPVVTHQPHTAAGRDAEAVTSAETRELEEEAAETRELEEEARRLAVAATAAMRDLCGCGGPVPDASQGEVSSSHASLAASQASLAAFQCLEGRVTLTSPKGLRIGLSVARGGLNLDLNDDMDATGDFESLACTASDTDQLDDLRPGSAQSSVVSSRVSDSRGFFVQFEGFRQTFCTDEAATDGGEPDILQNDDDASTMACSSEADTSGKSVVSVASVTCGEEATRCGPEQLGHEGDEYIAEVQTKSAARRPVLQRVRTPNGSPIYVPVATGRQVAQKSPNRRMRLVQMYNKGASSSAPRLVGGHRLCIP